MSSALKLEAGEPRELTTDCKGFACLVHGGARGVGHMAIQINRAFGAEGYATGSANSQAVIAERCATPIDYRSVLPRIVVHLISKAAVGCRQNFPKDERATRSSPASICNANRDSRPALRIRATYQTVAENCSVRVQYDLILQIEPGRAANIGTLSKDFRIPMRSVPQRRQSNCC